MVRRERVGGCGDNRRHRGRRVGLRVGEHGGAHGEERGEGARKDGGGGAAGGARSSYSAHGEPGHGVWQCADRCSGYGVCSNPSAHTNNRAVLVFASRYWFNYRVSPLRIVGI